MLRNNTMWQVTSYDSVLASRLALRNGLPSSGRGVGSFIEHYNKNKQLQRATLAMAHDKRLVASCYM